MLFNDKNMQAFIMAAGFGSRLRPHTLHTPKPLVKVGGRTLLDYIIDDLKQAGVRDVVMNAHYLADQIETYAKGRADLCVRVSREDTILETGGGLLYALPMLEARPFFVINGDAFLTCGTYGKSYSLLDDMKTYWRDEDMDILIALQPVDTMVVTEGVGDYFIDSDGRARRSKDRTGTHMFTSVRINHPRIFDGVDAGRRAFSYLEQLDEAEAAGRLFAIEHKGDFHHISTPADLEAVEKAVFS